MRERPDISRYASAAYVVTPFVLTLIWGALLRDRTIDPNAFPIRSGEARGLYLVALLMACWPVVVLFVREPWPRPGWMWIFGTAVATLGSLVAVMHYHSWSGIILLATLTSVSAAMLSDEMRDKIELAIGRIPGQALIVAISSLALLSMTYGFRARTAVAGPVTALLVIGWMLALHPSRSNPRSILPATFVGGLLMFELHWVLDHWPSDRWEGGAILALTLGGLVSALQQHLRSQRRSTHQIRRQGTPRDPLT